VSLASSDPTLARVPQTLLVPAGATWANFTVATSVTGDAATVIISAHYAGAMQSATLAVLPSTTLGNMVPIARLAQGTRQIAVMRPSTHEWFLRQDDGSVQHFQFGGSEDVPVPADYFGKGRVQIAVFRPSTSEWFIRTEDGGAVRLAWGTWGDRPVPGDYQ